VNKVPLGSVQVYIDKATIFLDGLLNPNVQKLQALDPKFTALENQQTITQAQYSALNAERDAIRNNYNINGIPKAVELIEIYNSLTVEGQSTVKASDFSINSITQKIQAFAALSSSQKERLYALSQKIEGRGEGE
jgi:hypothetical protein